MDNSDSTILEQIVKRVVASLEHDELFTGDLVQQIARILGSDAIADQAMIVRILEGESFEDPRPRD